MLRGRLRPAGLALALITLSGALVVGGIAAPASATTSVATAAARILADTNALRAANGKPALIGNPAIDAVAQSWAAQLAQPGQPFAHNQSFFTQMPSGATSGAENIAAGFSYATVVNSGWAKSSGHLANMLGTYTDIGIGYYESSDGSTYFVQDFGYYPSHAGQMTATPTATPTPTPTSTASTTAPTPSPAPSAPEATTSNTALVPLSSLPAPVASTATAPIPNVSGSKLVDSRTGGTWVPHAVNWPSFEYACQQGWADAQDGRTDTAAKAMVSWGINAVRLPLNEDCWLGTDGSPRYGTSAGYQAAIRQWVDILNANGIVVILDLHWSGGTGADSDGQRAMADDQTPLFWEQVSYAYSKVPSVMFDAFNEPYSRDSSTLSWSCWANGGCRMPDVNDESPLNGRTFTVTGMKDVLSAIRGTGATQPVLLAGLDYANDLRDWLANRPNDSQLVASWHNYPGQRCQTSTCWNNEVAPVAAQVPVIATEFGETDGGMSFLTTFMNWADSKGIGYSPWAWWWTDASDGAEANAYALIQNGGFTPKAPEGTTYFQHLAALGSGGPSALQSYWSAHGGSSGQIGSATSSAAYLPQNGGGWYQQFQGGNVYSSSAGGTVFVANNIILATYHAWGGPAGGLSWPNGEQMCSTGARCLQSFLNAAISTSSEFGAHVVAGGLRDYWVSSGAANGPLGAAWGDMAFRQGSAGPGWRQNFQGGILVQSGYGFQVVPYSSVLMTWLGLGDGTGFLGWPTGAYGCTGSGCVQQFAGGMISSSSWGTYYSYGGISGYWASHSGPSALGPAVSVLRYSAINGGGWAQHFGAGVITQAAGGSAIFTPYGPILNTWYHYGAEYTWLGWPTAGQTCSAGTCTQPFQHGIAISDPSGGVAFNPR